MIRHGFAKNEIMLPVFLIVVAPLLTHAGFISLKEDHDNATGRTPPATRRVESSGIGAIDCRSLCHQTAGRIRRRCYQDRAARNRRPASSLANDRGWHLALVARPDP